MQLSALGSECQFASCHRAAIVHQLWDCRNIACSLRDIAGHAHDTAHEALMAWTYTPKMKINALMPQHGLPDYRHALHPNAECLMSHRHLAGAIGFN